MSECWDAYDVEWIMERVEEMEHTPDEIEFDEENRKVKIVFGFNEQ